MKVLVIQDSWGLWPELAVQLERAGHACQQIAASSLPEYSGQTAWDAILIDLAQSPLLQVAVVVELHSTQVSAPVMLLTEPGLLAAALPAMKAGADDYLVMPVALADLVAHLELARLRHVRKPTSLQLGNVVLDICAHSIRAGKSEVELTATEVKMLELLMRHSGRVVTRNMLYERLWGIQFEGNANALNVHINRLRTKLTRKLRVPLISTVRGQGYAMRIGKQTVG